VSWLSRAAAFGAAILIGSPAVVAVVAMGNDAESDPEAGREIYGRCLACHAIEYDRVGPRHCGLFGRRAGSVPEFPYSAAMRQAGIVWSRETLNAFLSDPPGFVPGTFMTYAGIPDPRERSQLIAWLELATSPDRCSPRAPNIQVAPPGPP